MPLAKLSLRSKKILKGTESVLSFSKDTTYWSISTKHHSQISTLNENTV